MSTTFNETLPGAAVIEAETYEPISTEAVSVTQPLSEAAEQYKILRYRLEVLARGGVKSLAFASAQRGDGRTTTAVNTAVSLGRGGRNRVALVDADLRKPGVHKMLGLRPREGLADVVAGRAALDGCLWRFGSDELYVLPAGNAPDDPARTLYDPRLGQLFHELRERFDFVVVDCPPVLSMADVPTLCRDLDGALMVVRAGRTDGEILSSALDALYGVPVHGLVLNAVDRSEVRALGAAPPSRLLLPPGRG